MRIGDEVADKPGRQVPENLLPIVKEDSNPFVGRGGLKLEHALKTFQLSAAGKTAVDIGASTGGFTDCLLQHGALEVFAVDVGYGQLDWKIRSDPRVTVLDRKNARGLTLGDLGGSALDLAVIDVSFISLQRVIPPVLKLLKPSADLVALVKPQFEVGRDEVENKGIIKDPRKHLNVLLTLCEFVRKQGWVVCDCAPSPITGQKGNREFFVHCVSAGRGDPVDETTLRDIVLKEAG